MNPKTVRSVVGPRFSNLLTLAEDTALHYARCSDTNDVGECTPCIEMCGRAEEIDEATKLIESRLLKKEGREGESKQTHIMDMQRRRKYESFSHTFFFEQMIIEVKASVGVSVVRKPPRPRPWQTLRLIRLTAPRLVELLDAQDYCLILLHLVFDLAHSGLHPSN